MTTIPSRHDKYELIKYNVILTESVTELGEAQFDAHILHTRV